jgi:hypothetical protein
MTYIRIPFAARFVVVNLTPSRFQFRTIAECMCCEAHELTRQFAFNLTRKGVNKS